MPSKAMRKHLRTVAEMLTANYHPNLTEAVDGMERAMISVALRANKRSVTKAARALGVSYQRLAYVIKVRYPALLRERRSIQPRRKRKTDVVAD